MTLGWDWDYSSGNGSSIQSLFQCSRSQTLTYAEICVLPSDATPACPGCLSTAACIPTNAAWHGTLHCLPAGFWVPFRALAKFDLGDKQGAIADYNQAIAINPQFADAFYNRGLAKSDLGDKRGAIADYNQAIAIKPQFANAFYNRGLAKSDLGDKRGSIADYSQAIAINPQHADAYNNRGVAKSILGDKRGAIADYSQALAIDPFYADAYNRGGDANFSLGDKRGACADYTKSVSGPGSQYSKAERWYYGEGGVWCRYMHLDRQLLP